MAIKQSKSRKAFVVINYFLLGLLAIICIFPFIHLLAVSLSGDEFTSAGLVFFQEDLHLMHIKY